MGRARLKNSAITLIEYVMLIIIVLGAFYVFSPKILNSFHGHWKTAGDSFAFGRQYQPSKTAECAYAQINANFGIWFDNVCYTQAISNCPAGDVACEDAAKYKCATPDVLAYCCANNDEAPGHSNCG